VAEAPTLNPESVFPIIIILILILIITNIHNSQSEWILKAHVVHIA